jgi:hypothetical protein
MVDSIRGIKNNINAVSLDKTGPKNWLDRHRANWADRQARTDRENPDNPEIINTIEYRYH